MKDAISDIRQKIENLAYKNEEHVRLSLVARVLQKLGWNIWDPCEVNSEYNATPHEDSTRVDIALFLTPRRPEVFIEVKAIGKITSDSLQKAELQLRDYNRDNTASFSIITDGRIWRFYLSQSGGKFKEKCFKVVDLLTDDLDVIEVSLCTFLKKSEIENGNAFREAQEYRELNDKQRAMEDSLPQARRVILEPSYPSLPDALIKLVADEGFTINVEEAQDFIKATANKIPRTLQPPLALPMKNVPTKPQTVFGTTVETLSFRPDNPPNLTFTKIIKATFGTQSTNKWNALVRCAVKDALQKNMSISRLKSLLSNVQEGQKNDEGYRPLPGMNVSVGGVAADNAWSLALLLAKELNVEITVRFRWREKDGAAYPGKEGLLQWKP